MKKIHKKHELKVPKCKKSSIPEYSTKLHRYHCVKIKPKHHYKVALIGRTYSMFNKAFIFYKNEGYSDVVADRKAYRDVKEWREFAKKHKAKLEVK